MVIITGLNVGLQGSYHGRANGIPRLPDPLKTLPSIPVALHILHGIVLAMVPLAFWQDWAWLWRWNGRRCRGHVEMRPKARLCSKGAQAILKVPVECCNAMFILPFRAIWGFIRAQNG